MAPANATPDASGLNSGLILLVFAPVFLLTIGAEAQHQRGRDPSIYSFKDTVSNACLTFVHQASDAFFLWLMIKTAYSQTYNHGLRIVLEMWRSLMLLLLLQDFLYYFSHRASHRVCWTWALHVTHYSSESVNFSTTFRQNLTYPTSGM